MLLLDQRGTGRSTPVTARTASRFTSAAQLAAYLTHFRADAIVADAELIRHQLCGGGPWETLGQSYGGFITLTYLSHAPEGLRACYVTGGLPGLSATADDVYARTYPRVRDRVLDFYARYPHDASRLRKIADLLSADDIRLPGGDRLTTGRLRALGLALGMGDGFERIHWLLDESLDADGELTDTFLHQVEALTGFTDNPLFAVMQETLYGQGSAPSAWAASRSLAGFPEFAEDGGPSPPHRRNDLPVDVPGDQGPAPLRGRGGPPGPPQRLAVALRPATPGRQPGPPGRGGLPRRHVRRRGPLPAHGTRSRCHPGLGHQ